MKRNKMKENKQIFREVWNAIRYINISIIGVPKMEERIPKSKIFEELMSNYIINLMKNINLYIKVAQLQVRKTQSDPYLKRIW